jgi:hypothetical protein
VLSNDAAAVIHEQMAPDEDLLWSGQPMGGVRFRSSDLLMVPFSLMWGGFAFFWEAAALTTDAPIFFKLWGVPFVLIGIYIIIGRFFWDAHRRARTFYGVTDRRIVIVTTGVGARVKSLQMRTLSDVTLSTSRDGSGTIAFGPSPAGSWWLTGSGWPGAQAQAPQFELIGQAKATYDLIGEAQRRAGNAAPGAGA